MKRLYEITRVLSGKTRNPSLPVKDKDGNTITSDGDQRKRWAEHFMETLNRPPPSVPADIPPPEQQLDINTALPPRPRL